jgi:hypothetical protein
MVTIQSTPLIVAALDSDNQVDSASTTALKAKAGASHNHARDAGPGIASDKAAEDTKHTVSTAIERSSNSRHGAKGVARSISFALPKGEP